MENKKMVSVVVPIYNEISMIDEIYSRISKVFEKLDNYEYEIVFFDDGSTDGTKEAIEELSLKYSEVKGVFYAKNFGYLKNSFYCMQQAKGDCAIIIHADLQNPPELIPQFIEKWEAGAQVVLGVKNKSRENKMMYFLRSVFYFLMITVFGVKMKAHATEFELFDRSFIDVLKRIRTNTPFLRGIVSEYASKIDYLYYVQDARNKGKSKFNLDKYYDFAICGITKYSKKLPRKVIAFTSFCMLISVLEIGFHFMPQCWNLPGLDVSNGLIIRLILFGLYVLIILVSVLFEYIISALDELTDKPLIVEEKRINY